MSEKKVRWGFLGASWIGMKNWQSLALCGNGRLIAVASRDKSKAEKWIDRCSSHVPFSRRPEAVEGYEALLARDDIDAIYIPLPTGIRKEWAIKAARSGKHILCEKPSGTNVEDVQEIIDECKKSNVQFMDGVMFMHSNRLKKLRKAMDHIDHDHDRNDRNRDDHNDRDDLNDDHDDDHDFGELRRITSQFSFNASDEFLKNNIRMHSGLEPLGCLGDLGWYNVRFALWAMNYQMPEKVSGCIFAEASRPDSPSPVPMEFSGEMHFGNGISSSYFCSFIAATQQWANLSGTKGNIYLDDFVVPCYGSEVSFMFSKMMINEYECDFNMERRDERIVAPEYSNSHPSAQETRLFSHFNELVIGGRPDHFWGEISIKTQRILMASLSSSKNGGIPILL